MTLIDFQIVPHGDTQYGDDGSVVVQAGWGQTSKLFFMANLLFDGKTKVEKIYAEFKGYTETIWASRFATAEKVESNSYRVLPHQPTNFQRWSTSVYDSKKSGPLEPNKYSIPFIFVLPKSKLPPTFFSPAGTIDYIVTCTILYEEGWRNKTKTVHCPITVVMPDQAKVEMLRIASRLSKVEDEDVERVLYTLTIDKSVVTIGDHLNVSLTIKQTPETSKLKALYITLLPIVEYMSPHGHKVIPDAVRKSFIDEAFYEFSTPVRVGNGYADPLEFKYVLEVDPSTNAKPSFESSFISVRTVLRLMIVLDNSAAAAVMETIPITVLPKLMDSAMYDRVGSPTSATAGLDVLSFYFDSPFFTGGGKGKINQETLSISGLSLASPAISPMLSGRSPNIIEGHLAPLPEPMPIFSSNTDSASLFVHVPERKSTSSNSRVTEPISISTNSRPSEASDLLNVPILSSPPAVSKTQSNGFLGGLFRRGKKKEPELPPPVNTSWPIYGSQTTPSSPMQALAPSNLWSPAGDDHPHRAPGPATIDNTLPIDWTAQLVRDWAKLKGAPPEIQMSIIANHVDGTKLLSMTDKKLEALGISEQLVRERLLKAIQELKLMSS